MIHLNTDHRRFTKGRHFYWAIDVTCDFCKVRYSQQRSFALSKNTHRCRRCANKGKNNWNRTGKTPTNFKIKCVITCNYCKNTLLRSKRELSKRSLHFCNNSCQLKWQHLNTPELFRGRNNASFIHGERVDGRNPSYGPEFDAKLKRLIRMRDGFNCQRCGSNFSGKRSKKLDVHHIDCNKYNNRKNNLISLCKSCHTKTHWELKKLNNIKELP